MIQKHETQIAAQVKKEIPLRTLLINLYKTFLHLGPDKSVADCGGEASK